MRRSTVQQMRVDRVDAAMAIDPTWSLRFKREFLSSGFDQQLPAQLFSFDLVGDQLGEEKTGHADRRRRIDGRERDDQPTAIGADELVGGFRLRIRRPDGEPQRTGERS